MKAVRIGKCRCYECGGEKFLLVNRNGIFSICSKCGFNEWEWTWGDSVDYLYYLADRYGVKADELLNALEVVRWT